MHHTYNLEPCEIVEMQQCNVHHGADHNVESV